MKSLSFACLAIVILIFTSNCAVPKFQPSYGTSYRSLLRGEMTEALASYEAQAQDAEKSAAASWFPQYDWGTATVAYAEASRLAQWSGQLQKGITYGEKALQVAEKSKAPVHQVIAIHMLIDAYTSVRNFERARELIDRGLVIVSANPHIGYRGTLYLHLGNDLMRRREFENAAYAYSQSFDLDAIRTDEMKASVVLRHGRDEFQERCRIDCLGEIL